MRTLNFRLMSVLLTVLFVTVLAVAGVNIGFTANTVLANGQTALQIRAEKEANAIDGWVKKLIATIDTNAIQTGIILGNYDGDIYSLAPKYAEIAEQVGIFDCYFGVPDGNCVFGSGWLPDYSAGWASYKRPWYIAATENPGQTIITDPYIDAQTGEVCYTFAKTISDDAGKTIGVFAIDALLGDVTKIIEDAATFDDTASAFLIQPNGDILIHTDESFNPTMDANEEIVLQNLYDDKDFETYKNNSIFSANGHFYAVTDISSTNWKLFVSVDRSSIIRPVIISFMVGLLVFAVLFIISAALVMLVIRKYATNPIKEVEAAAKQLASGETTVVVSPQSTLEMQNLADAFRAVCANSSRQEEVLVKVADGDLTVEHTLLSERDTMGMALQKMLDNLNNMFGEINSSASMVSEGAKQIANGSQSLAQGASEQTASVDRLSSTITEITARTTENADIAREAAELSDTIKRSAEKGSAQMEQMMQAVKDINEASGQINKVIKVIDDIAFQTNILALNAAVEAARAGQHGKGFAVVADEVRNLAAKSADAAKDTGGLIENSIEKANLGYNIAIETSASLKEIVEGINRSAEIVAQIAQSSDSQASAIAQISTGINQVAQVVQQNSATAEESASASAEMNGQSNTLTNLVSQFQLKNA